MKIKVHCAAGYSPDCLQTVEVDLPYDGLSTEDIATQWVTENGRNRVTSIEITPTTSHWVEQNAYLLSPSDIEHIKAHGFFRIQYSDLERKVCCACYTSNPDSSPR